jgi:hypothetical protein
MEQGPRTTNGRESFPASTASTSSRPFRTVVSAVGETGIFFLSLFGEDNGFSSRTRRFASLGASFAVVVIKGLYSFF